MAISSLNLPEACNPQRGCTWSEISESRRHFLRKISLRSQPVVTGVHSWFIESRPRRIRDLVVKRQEVVSRRVESGHRRDVANTAVRAMPVVVVQPVCQGIGSVS